MTVGEALARGGMPLMGSDVSIPAAGEPLPGDGRILIVPVSDRFTRNAEPVRRETEWTANAELDLDETRLITVGSDGLKGTFTRIRTENGRIVLTETSPEQTLVSPVNDRSEYGTKVTVRTLDTPDGPVEYYRAVTVYATAYSPCRSGTSSCITGTASGRKVAKGIVAVTSAWYANPSMSRITARGLSLMLAAASRADAGSTWLIRTMISSAGAGRLHFTSSRRFRQIWYGYCNDQNDASSETSRKISPPSAQGAGPKFSFG